MHAFSVVATPDEKQLNISRWCSAVRMNHETLSRYSPFGPRHQYGLFKKYSFTRNASVIPKRYTTSTRKEMEYHLTIIVLTLVATPSCTRGQGGQQESCLAPVPKLRRQSTTQALGLSLVLSKSLKELLRILAEAKDLSLEQGARCCRYSSTPGECQRNTEWCQLQCVDRGHIRVDSLVGRAGHPHEKVARSSGVDTADRVSSEVRYTGPGARSGKHSGP